MDGQKWARLVAKGYSQGEGIDYSEIFSPVIHYESIHLMFVLVGLENWYITGLNVKTAFLYGKLNKEIYMKQPEGFTTQGQGSKVMHLWPPLLPALQPPWCTSSSPPQCTGASPWPWPPSTSPEPAFAGPALIRLGMLSEHWWQTFFDDKCWQLVIMDKKVLLIS